MLPGDQEFSRQSAGMVIEMILSAIVTAIFGVMILLEWPATDTSAETKSPKGPHFLHRADTLLGLCIVVCNAAIWLPPLFR